MALGILDKNNGLPLYGVSEMRTFAELHTPGLFNVFLNIILRKDSRFSEDRRHLQEQRTVALLHILTYFRCA